MKINCGLSAEEKRVKYGEMLLTERVRQRDWHDWFAWFPVRVGTNDCRWLETIQRRQPFAYVAYGRIHGRIHGRFDYRAKQ